MLRGKCAFSSPGVYAWGEKGPQFFGPFRGHGAMAHAPKGAKTGKKRRFPRPRRKRLG